MRSRIKPWLLLALLAAATAAIIFAIHSFRYRFVRSEADMLSLLPKEDATIFFVNVAGLRHAGMLNLLTGSRPAMDPEYRDFVRETHFDYSKNLDAIAGAADDKQVFLVIRGRFEWGSLRRYASTHGGSCANKVCRIPTSRAGRWASFLAVQPDVMSLALSTDGSAANALRPPGRRVSQEVPAQPVWVTVSQSLLKNPVNLPVPVRIFAISLQSADSVTLSLAPGEANSGAAFEMLLDARCPSEATAETARSQLQIETKMLKLGLTREHEQPNPSDLTGLLTAGTFEAVNKHVIGRWPVRRELLKALE